MKPITHASLFSGIGGPEVAAAMLGWDNLFHCEINQFCRSVLEYWFPKSESYEDIKQTDFTKWQGKIDVLTGGFPCQPFSTAGKRKGENDDRYLWPQMLRVIEEVRPDWIIGENVAGITSMVEQGKVSPMEIQTALFDETNGVPRYRYDQTFTIERICKDLESLQYSVQPVLIPACAVGAPHQRNRVFIIANANRSSNRRKAGENERESAEKRLQEWNEIWEPYISNQVRPKGERPAKNTDGMGLYGIEELEYEQRQGDAWPTSNDGQIRQSSSNTSCEQGKRIGYEQREISREKQAQFGGSWGEDGNRRIYTAANGNGLQGRIFTRGDNFKGWNRQVESAAFYSNRPWSISVGERWNAFPTVSPIHRGNDGLPFNVDDLSIPFSKWRTESLKAYGNAIVPQVMYEIFSAIEYVIQQTE